MALSLNDPARSTWVNSIAGLVVALVAMDSVAQISFVEVAEKSGINFTHDSGMTGQLWTVEITGAGVGILDVDGDGWMDIWLVQGGPLTDRVKRALPHDRLFLNASKSAEPGQQTTLRFIDASKARGLSETTGYGMGIATGDVDNDGDTDVLLTNYGANQLWLNHDGRFENVSTAIPDDDRWSISASFADLDADGLLDIYIGNYLRFSVTDHEPCRRWSGRLSYCAPANFEAATDQLLFQERTDLGAVLKFVDVSRATGLTRVRGGAMGVVIEDLDDDGRPDIYVANDGVVNHLWLNRGTRRFTEDALMAGLAVNADGVAEASMGIAAADIDNDGDVDLLVSHDIKESNTLYTNQSGWFSDESSARGLAADSLAFSAFGTGWLDVENDGDLDLFVANGAVTVIESQEEAGIRPPLRQRNQLYENVGGDFRVVPALFTAEDVSRGVGFGDLDNDGDLDLVVNNNHGPTRVYRNDSSGGHWIGLSIHGNDRVNPTGTLVWRETRGESGERGRTHRRTVRTDGSYASANDPRILYGLGETDRDQFVVLRWRDGREERFGPLATGRYHNLRYGEGQGLD